MRYPLQHETICCNISDISLSSVVSAIFFPIKSDIHVTVKTALRSPVTTKHRHDCWSMLTKLRHYMDSGIWGDKTMDGGWIHPSSRSPLLLHPYDFTPQLPCLLLSIARARLCAVQVFALPLSHLGSPRRQAVNGRSADDILDICQHFGLWGCDISPKYGPYMGCEVVINMVF